MTQWATYECPECGATVDIDTDATAGDVLLCECCEVRRLDAENKRLRAALKLTEFGFNHSRCPVCAGFGVGPNGETDKVHTRECPVSLALSQ